ncbi:MAG TPA: class I SAM-dependent methyltransferase [Anaerolineales bacterium]|nr:class I SAM-dependent methyltransferase [Anaerolineales bacterium]
MTVRVDPENNETRALFSLFDFSGKRVLEIGCGDGRLTWRYADMAEHVIAIDPKTDAITRARDNLPKELQGRIEFHRFTFEDFSTISKLAHFDSIIFSWSF